MSFCMPVLYARFMCPFCMSGLLGNKQCKREPFTGNSLSLPKLSPEIEIEIKCHFAVNGSAGKLTLNIYCYIRIYMSLHCEYCYTLQTDNGNTKCLFPTTHGSTLKRCHSVGIIIGKSPYKCVLLM